jgi:hypothetical protein
VSRNGLAGAGADVHLEHAASGLVVVDRSAADVVWIRGPGFRDRRLPGSIIEASFPQPDLWGSEYFQAYPSTDRDLGSIAMDHRALLHHSFTSSPGKEQSAIQP